MTTLASALISRGHRVRLATHRTFRPLVTASDARIDFYPLHGDPAELVAFMRDCYAHSPLRLAASLIDELPKYATMMRRIFESCWDAFTAPLCPPGAFHALISNPATYAHIHIAEKTGLPLHIFFSQPWVKTKAFPHPLAGYVGEPSWSAQNLLTYDLIESSIYAGLRREVNYFRTEVLGLEPLSAFSQGWDLLSICKVPFTGLYSPTLMPRPKDWPSHCSVAGACGLPEHTSEDCLQQLKRLSARSELPLIYVGFGSMILTSAELKLLFQWIDYAVSSMSIRILFQITDGKLINEISTIQRSMTSQCFVVNDLEELSAMESPTVQVIVLTCVVSHEALFQRCSGVVHHGGSGTTHRSLSAGRPTMIVPFFADQFSLGKMVQRLGCGPEPLPLCKHSTVTFAAGVASLLSTGCKEAALALSRQLMREDGVEAAVATWEQHLPVRKMVCVAALIDGVRTTTNRRTCPASCTHVCVVHPSLSRDNQKSWSELPCIDWKALRQTNYRSEAIVTTSSLAIELAKDVSLALYLQTKNITASPLLLNISYPALYPLSILKSLAKLVSAKYLPYAGYHDNGPIGLYSDDVKGIPLSQTSNPSSYEDSDPDESISSSHVLAPSSLCRFIRDEYFPLNENFPIFQNNFSAPHQSEGRDKTLELLSYLNSYSDSDFEINIAKLIEEVCAESNVPEGRWSEYYDAMMRSGDDECSSFGLFDMITSLYC